MTAIATQTIQKTNFLTILQRVAQKDKTALKDCIDTYGNFVWALARKFTASHGEAEEVTQEIFTDIWRYSERIDKSHYAERVLIALIARRRLIKYLQ